MTRGPILGGHPAWEWLVEPGAVWRTGEGYRALLPVAWRERNANCLHNGLLALRWADGASQAVAHLRINSETCAYFQFDLEAVAEATIEPLPERLAHLREPVPTLRYNRRPITAVADDFPGTDASAFAHRDEVAPDSLTTHGLLIGETLYAGPCPTRSGSDPFCEVRPLPSYSVAKSAVAGIALMRLEALYPGTRNALISDHVPECATNAWRDVTFEHALDMATGLYNDPAFHADETAPAFWSFIGQESHAARIAIACSVYERQTGPGRHFVYHTTDTYVLGTALQSYWRSRTGDPDADFYTDLLVPLWREIGLSPLAETVLRTYDTAAQPATGLGLSLHFEDFMRIGRFLQDGAKGRLDPDLLNAALQRDPADRGLPAGGDMQRYQNGFWAWNAGPTLGCDAALWIPVMSGYGGITIALLPNGHVYGYVSDGNDFAWARAAAASHSIHSLCEDDR
ncbi:serine hydrolase domain-containing protein [Maricaulis sp. CAU 1757]